MPSGLDITLSQAADLAQVATAVATVIGIIVTLCIAVSTIRELRQDRVLRHRPYLTFEQTPSSLRVHFLPVGQFIPGFNPAYVAKMFPTLPHDAKAVRLVDHDPNLLGVGKLTNYGVGPALFVEVTWIAHRVRIGTESFEIDERKQKESLYCRDLNTLPAWRAHIAPGTATTLCQLPTFIEKDIEQKITEVTGVIEIACMDIFHSRLITRQEFRITTRYKEERAYVIVNFDNVISEPPPERMIATVKLLQRVCGEMLFGR